MDSQPHMYTYICIYIYKVIFMCKCKICTYVYVDTHTHAQIHTHLYSPCFYNSVNIWFSHKLKMISCWYSRRALDIEQVTPVASHIPMSHNSCTNESCHSFVWVVSLRWMSHVTRGNELCHMYEWSTGMNESCHSWEWVMSHVWTIHMY